MRLTIHKIAKGFAMLAAGLLLASCNDWTQTESTDIHNPSFEEKNPEQWAAYLRDLKAYKDSDHPVLYAIFDNTAKPASAGDRLTTMPDSLDIIALKNPGKPEQWLIDDIAKVQTKSTKVLCTFNFTDLETRYETQAVETDGAEDGFLAFAGRWLDDQLGLCKKYGFDGITANLIVPATDHMTDAEKEQYVAREALFLERIRTWLDANPSKMLVFEGTPQFLNDKSLLPRAKYIVLRSVEQPSALTGYDTQCASAANNEGVPADRLIISVDPYSTDSSDKTTGFITASGSPVRALSAAPWWVITPSAYFGKAGLAVNNIQNEYYLIVKKDGEKKYIPYQFTREAIAVMNPTPKN